MYRCYHFQSSFPLSNAISYTISAAMQIFLSLLSSQHFWPPKFPASHRWSPKNFGCPIFLRISYALFFYSQTPILYEKFSKAQNFVPFSAPFTVLLYFYRNLRGRTFVRMRWRKQKQASSFQFHTTPRSPKRQAGRTWRGVKKVKTRLTRSASASIASRIYPKQSSCDAGSRTGQSDPARPSSHPGTIQYQSHLVSCREWRQTLVARRRLAATT